jgi:hypothetical protein
MPGLPTSPSSFTPCEAASSTKIVTCGLRTKPLSSSRFWISACASSSEKPSTCTAEPGARLKRRPLALEQTRRSQNSGWLRRVDDRLGPACFLQPPPRKAPGVPALFDAGSASRYQPPDLGLSYCPGRRSRPDSGSLRAGHSSDRAGYFADLGTSGVIAAPFLQQIQSGLFA